MALADWLLPPELDWDGDCFVDDVGVAMSLSVPDVGGAGMGATVARPTGYSTSAAMANMVSSRVGLNTGRIVSRSSRGWLKAQVDKLGEDAALGKSTTPSCWFGNR